MRSPSPPDAIDASGQAAFAAALVDPTRGCPAGLRCWNGSDPAARLAVHRNNVIGSLVDALAETFPVAQELVGTTFFRAMAALFVRRSPPRSPVLALYGAAFPAFIGDFEPARSVAYLADVAALEWARVAAYHATDAEPISGEAAAAALASGERVAEWRMGLHPSLSVVSSRHAAVSIWDVHQRAPAPGLAPLDGVDVDRPECAIVLRDGLDVVVLPASTGLAAFVAMAQQGESLGAAAAAGIQAEPPFELSAALTLLLCRGALTALEPMKEPSR